MDWDPRTLDDRPRPRRGALHLSRRPQLAFSAQRRTLILWAFPFDPAAGRLSGPGQPLTGPGINAFAPDLTSDMTKLVFQAEHTGRRHQREMRVRWLDDGRERVLFTDDLHRVESRLAPRWSPDGARLAYRYRPSGGKPSSRIVDLASGEEQVLTSPLPESSPQSWAPDGRHVLATLFLESGKTGIWLLPVDAAPHAEKADRIIASHPDYYLWQATYSPDGRWVSFNAVLTADARASTIHVVSEEGGPWTQITEGTYWDDKPRWSPDGRIIYFLSSREGTMNVWGIQFDPEAARAVGTPFPVTHFEGPGRMVSPDVFTAELVVAEDRLIVPIREVSGQIWILDVDR